MDMKQQRNLLLVAVVVLLVALGASLGTGGFDLAGSAGQGKGGGPPEGVPGNAKGIGKNEDGQFVVENEEELSNDPLALGASVVGPDAFVQGLNIGTSGGNNVVYVSEGALPAAYGAPNRSVTGEPGITNGCSLPGGGFLDIGAAPDYSYTTRQHQYEFTFTQGTVTTFSIGVVDYADFLPGGTNSDGVYGMIMTAYNSNGDVVDTDQIMFTTSDSGIARVTNEFGDLQTSGDACLAAQGTQPGNYIFRVSGQGISRVTLAFKDTASQDPNIALWAGPLEFTPEGDPPGTGTRGFWSNRGWTLGWPVSELTLGDTTYTAEEALEILNTPTSAGEDLQLQAQLIATKLNIISGNDGSCVQDAVDAADQYLRDGSLINGYDSPNAIKDQLDAYNNGLLGCADHRG